MKKLSLIAALLIFITTSITAYGNIPVKAAFGETSVTQKFKIKKHVLKLKRRRKLVVHY